MSIDSESVIVPKILEKESGKNSFQMKKQELDPILMKDIILTTVTIHPVKMTSIQIKSVKIV